VKRQAVGVDLCSRSLPSSRWRRGWWFSVCHPAGGNPTRFGDVVVLESGDPNFSVRIIEVEAGAGEALRLDALHVQAIAFVEVMVYGSHRVLLEAELLPLDEFLFSFASPGLPDVLRSRSRSQGVGWRRDPAEAGLRRRSP
jgi:hypothetical protein